MKTIEQALQLLEELRTKWGINREFLEKISNRDNDITAMTTKAQVIVLSECRNDIAALIQDIREDY